MEVRCPREPPAMGVWGFISSLANRADKQQAFVFPDFLSRLVSWFPTAAAMPHCIVEGPLAFLDI